LQEPIRRLISTDLPRLRNFWVEQWGSDFMMVHHEIIRYDEVEGFIHDDWTGLVTFKITDRECEIVSLDSLREGRGIGTALIETVLQEAHIRKCRRVHLTTTNDNLRALGFYQHRGFELSALRRGVLNESRKRKPSIPLTGMNNIPLRDELELEIVLT
jgi:GNAT superfamily N-acetyltransferase